MLHIFKYVSLGCVLPLFKYMNINNNYFALALHRFEIEIEPLFVTLALYDLKEKKKVNMSQLILRVLATQIWGRTFYPTMIVGVVLV